MSATEHGYGFPPEICRDDAARISKRDRNRAELTAGYLSEAFAWSESKEGHLFWSDVCSRLCRIADEGQ